MKQTLPDLESQLKKFKEIPTSISTSEQQGDTQQEPNVETAMDEKPLQAIRGIDTYTS